ncbi:MAG TPA: ATP-binding protein [candidate division Zixibacteria bacterium]|nr:ATP-binding protein [candidate division Zixibacteria bacterium]
MRRRWNNSLAFKFFFSYFVVTLLLFAGFYLYSAPLLRRFYVSHLSLRMEQEGRVLARVLPPRPDPGSLDAEARRLGRELRARVTVIAPDGRVLGDSDEPSQTMENHAFRPEVIEALRSGAGAATRYSTTVRYQMLYQAVRDGSGAQARIIRIAMPLSDVESVIASVRRTLLLGLLAVSGLGLLLALGFSRLLGRRIKRLVDFSLELARGSFPQNFFSRGRNDEIDVLEQHLSEMSASIRDHFEQLVAEKEKIASILRCMVEGVLVLDRNGNILLINEPAARMLHAETGRDLAGTSVLELSRRPELLAIVRGALGFDFERGLYSRELELKDGCWVRVNATGLLNGRGAVLGSILVFHDITELKRLEAVRSDFVANVSHELRTPLTAIRGYVETLLRSPPADPEVARTFLGIVDRHSERLSRLTEELLILADLESGKMRIARRPIDVAQLIQRALEVFADRASKKNVGLEHRLEPDLPPVLGDLDRLEQVLINLIDNAIKYTDAGGEIVVSAARARGEDRIEIAVADTGCGIPEQDLPRITERFYRVDKARSRELGGTGLGLAIVKHIVQALDGRLRIESAVRKGTTVRVDLPAATQRNRGNVLFLCTGNSCRSQMAEGFARRCAADGTRIYSAGTRPKGIHPLTVRVMNEAGVDISGQSSKSLEAVPVSEIDLVVTLCGESDEECPVPAGTAPRMHWPLPDPVAVQGDEETVLAAFRKVRDEIRARVEELFGCVPSR